MNGGLRGLEGPVRGKSGYNQFATPGLIRSRDRPGGPALNTNHSLTGLSLIVADIRPPLPSVQGPPDQILFTNSLCFPCIFHVQLEMCQFKNSLRKMWEFHVKYRNILYLILLPTYWLRSPHTR